MSLVVVCRCYVIHSWESDSVGSLLEDTIFNGGENLRISICCVASECNSSTTVEFYLLYRVARNGLVDTDTYLSTELTETEGNRFVIIRMAYKCMN